ncbi:putative ABC transporter ATP-binding protein [Actinoplanes missouriensis 431]|uniref:Putative ABC transporter ATP-binding protein n=1 Tax=Actinoplanes missouriensis (strain ATCC 14538 / DSM 43046 / CBS 188.64 / JCM 3121 / NBRC 102363 / NCIMB 12654 / NRRL B-3342 / UNCC 431) TaxID=512565 RepID=I0H8K3_ACTM4|nr:ABC transporter ATP-binding protein [Actinoplanes missouriensis]BAL89340.1 putative ABC transporter ATP-binding protein [Actinoplanes missouriensis 431]
MTLSIQTTGLRVRYGDTDALHGLDLDLPGGKIYGLLGRNGAGKSTLLGALAGFRKPAAGTVLIGGRPVFENPAVTSQICLIREDGSVGDPTDQLGDILDMARILRPTWDTAYANDLMDRFALPRKQTLNALSRGQRSAFGVVVGLASRAPLTMFDEAHLGMDAPTRQMFLDELLRDYLARPRTFVVSTHLIEEQSPLFEDVLVIADGRLLVHEELDELRTRGVSVTGPAELVEEFVAGLTVLGRQRLGPTLQAMVYGVLDDDHRRRAKAHGLELGPVGVQDLFIHLTGGEK